MGFRKQPSNYESNKKLAAALRKVVAVHLSFALRKNITYSVPDLFVMEDDAGYVSYTGNPSNFNIRTGSLPEIDRLGYNITILFCR